MTFQSLPSLPFPRKEEEILRPLGLCRRRPRRRLRRAPVMGSEGRGGGDSL